MLPPAGENSTARAEMGKAQLEGSGCEWWIREVKELTWRSHGIQAQLLA